MSECCPSCKATNIIKGKLFGGEFANGPLTYYRPNIKAWFLLSEGVLMSNAYFTCLSCGLFWQILDSKTLEAIVNFERDYRVL